MADLTEKRFADHMDIFSDIVNVLLSVIKEKRGKSAVGERDESVQS